MIFEKDLLYLRLFEDKIELKNLRTGNYISRIIQVTYSNERLLIADFKSLEKEVRIAIAELNGNKLLQRSSIIVFQPLHTRINNYSQVEKRSFRDFCCHVGAKVLYLYFGSELLSDQTIKNNISKKSTLFET